MSTALLVVDPQVDFVDGALGVPRGPAYIAAINEYLRDRAEDRLVIFSRDQHTDETEDEHFTTYPVHCKVGTPGADWHNRLSHNYADVVVNKGGKYADPSPFDGETAKGVILDDVLQDEGITKIEICGFVAEVCVEAAWQDAMQLGYETTLLVGLTAAINPREGMRDAVKAAIDAGVWIR